MDKGLEDWRQGFGVEAVCEIMRSGFEELGLQRWNRVSSIPYLFNTNGNFIQVLSVYIISSNI